MTREIRMNNMYRTNSAFSINFKYYCRTIDLTYHKVSFIDDGRRFEHGEFNC